MFPPAIKALSAISPSILSVPPAMKRSSRIGAMISTTPHAVKRVSSTVFSIRMFPLSSVIIFEAETDTGRNMRSTDVSIRRFFIERK
jgi:hypothetical protein